MIHLGDITKIKGAKIEPVDCITAGSPCQDLSVAGKRAGLEGERSGLFMEQIRIIKEMREHDRNNGRTDEFIRPRYMVWENVPGAFSSNKGEDFRCVLEETAKVAERDAVIPGPPKGKWSKSGAIMGDGWSIAWRVHDAQFWGVPQRRKRIALVADFGGFSAPEVLFERKGLSRDSEKSGEAREGAAAHAQGGTGKAISFQERAGKPGGGKGILIQDERTGALSTLNNQSVCYLNDHAVAYRKTSHAKSAEDGQGWAETEVNDTLNAFDSGETRTPTVVVGLETFHCTTEVDEEKVGAQTARGPGAVCTNYKADGAEGKGIAFATVGDHDGRPTDMTNLVQCESIVRRLTPLECERLQGFPDGWTDIGEWTDSKGKARKCSDSARYKALGNSIAIPFWFYILRRMAAQYERPATLGSLFDGIGGFPLCWERCNGKGTARWASEIEEFPIAVTKHWFG